MPKTTVLQQDKLSIIDNSSAPDIFADEAIGFLLTNNTVRITLASIKADHAKEGNARNLVVSNRLVMPISGVQNLHKLLSAMLEKMKTPQPEDTGVHILQ